VTGFPPRLRRVPTSELTAVEVATIRDLLWRAFEADGEGFAEEDWAHALGGIHLVREVAGEIVAHASVVERAIEIDGQPLRTGYVEAVATAPTRQRQGHGTAVMRAVGEVLDARYELGALGTGSHGFYERLGWATWAGPSAVRTPSGIDRTPDEDGYIMVYRTPITPPLNATGLITCEWRRGDVW
jgi:aminoglycoside 2'-N-acetyltransferase I